MNQEKLLALLKVSEGKPYLEILFSINLPSHILAKYQNLRNSLLNSEDFSLPKFETCYSPRLSKSLSSSYSKFSKLCLMSMQHIFDKTCFIIESSTRSKTFQISKSFSEIMKSDDQVKDLTILTDEIESLSSQITENLEIIKGNLNSAQNNVKEIEETSRNARNLRSEEQVQMIQGENERLRRENLELKEEAENLKEKWNLELDNAREKWSSGLDCMKNNFEKNIKEITDSYENQIKTLKAVNKEKFEMFKESQLKVASSLRSDKNEQSEIINKLNDKILMFTARSSEDANFMEKVMNLLDEIFERFLVKEVRCAVTGMKDKILMRLESLIKFFEGQEQTSKKTGKNFKSGLGLKEKLIENNIILKEFEEARSKLMLHFHDSPKGRKLQAFTTRF